MDAGRDRGQQKLGGHMARIPRTGKRQRGDVPNQNRSHAICALSEGGGRERIRHAPVAPDQGRQQARTPCVLEIPQLLLHQIFQPCLHRSHH